MVFQSLLLTLGSRCEFGFGPFNFRGPNYSSITQLVGGDAPFRLGHSILGARPTVESLESSLGLESSRIEHLPRPYLGGIHDLAHVNSCRHPCLATGAERLPQVLGDMPDGHRYASHAQWKVPEHLFSSLLLPGSTRNAFLELL